MSAGVAPSPTSTRLVCPLMVSSTVGMDHGRTRYWIPPLVVPLLGKPPPPPGTLEDVTVPAGVLAGVFVWLSVDSSGTACPPSPVTTWLESLLYVGLKCDAS